VYPFRGPLCVVLVRLRITDVHQKPPSAMCFATKPSKRCTVFTTHF
jgi:hypothetical protein